jgi:hypothetical protein
LHTFLFSTMRATCLAFYLICLIMSWDECKLRIFSLCFFLHSPVTSSLLGPNILLRTLFSNTFSLRLCFHIQHFTKCNNYFVTCSTFITSFVGYI